jgi:membrane protease YdiL (CAAX protease family)
MWLRQPSPRDTRLVLIPLRLNHGTDTLAHSTFKRGSPLNNAQNKGQHESVGEADGEDGNNEPFGLLPERDSLEPSPIRYIFFGREGLRAGWGLLFMLALYTALGSIFGLRFWWVPGQHAAPPPVAHAIPWQNLLVGDGIAFFCVLAATWAMSRIEDRPIGHYGFGGKHRIAHFVQGFAWGLAFLSLLVAALWGAGLLVFDGRLLGPTPAIEYGALWLLGFLVVGLLEEYLTRGYLQFTLARGLASLYGQFVGEKHKSALGFWTAAIVMSIAFGLGHGSNPGESPIGLVAAGLIGLIFCLTLWRTGSLWWALGFHASWDWAQSFLFGVADSGTMVQGHLFATHPVGKVLLSGGATGPEGSALILPLLLVLAGVVVLIPKEPQEAHL